MHLQLPCYLSCSSARCSSAEVLEPLNPASPHPALRLPSAHAADVRLGRLRQRREDWNLVALLARWQPHGCTTRALGPATMLSLCWRRRWWRLRRCRTKPPTQFQSTSIASGRGERFNRWEKLVHGVGGVALRVCPRGAVREPDAPRRTSCRAERKKVAAGRLDTPIHATLHSVIRRRATAKVARCAVVAKIPTQKDPTTQVARAVATPRWTCWWRWWRRPTGRGCFRQVNWCVCSRLAEREQLGKWRGPFRSLREYLWQPKQRLDGRRNRRVFELRGLTRAG